MTEATSGFTYSCTRKITLTRQRKKVHCRHYDFDISARERERTGKCRRKSVPFIVISERERGGRVMGKEKTHLDIRPAIRAGLFSFSGEGENDSL